MSLQDGTEAGAGDTSSGSMTPRRPGELVFNTAMTMGSAALLYSAYGISGFEALSGAGAIPMAASATMLVCSGITLRETLAKPAGGDGSIARDILPAPVLVTIAMITAYAVALRWLGFIPTSFLFLVVMTRYLEKRSWLWSALVSLVTVAVIYLIFRLVFTVLMPQGIVPEGEIIAWFRHLFKGGN